MGNAISQQSSPQNTASSTQLHQHQQSAKTPVSQTVTITQNSPDGLKTSSYAIEPPFVGEIGRFHILGDKIFLRQDLIDNLVLYTFGGLFFTILLAKGLRIKKTEDLRGWQKLGLQLAGVSSPTKPRLGTKILLTITGNRSCLADHELPHDQALKLKNILKGMTIRPGTIASANLNKSASPTQLGARTYYTQAHGRPGQILPSAKAFR